jgi:prepilin-type N-terminal cleavage/methylation domain-containing protein
MLTAGRRPSGPDAEAGFTMVELMVTMLIMSVVLAIGGSMLFSMSNTAARNDAMVQQEQAAGTVLAAMARDIRSTHAISLPGTADEQVMLQENTGTPGSYTYVEWTYNPTAGTVTRSTASTAAGPFTVTGPAAADVTNGAGTGIFTYYNVNGAPITTSIASCASRIGVTLDVSTTTAGVPAYVTSQDVALTDQTQIISAPGNGQC